VPTYDYQDLVTGEVFEVEQRISEPAFTHRHPPSGTLHHAPTSGVGLLERGGNHPIKRLISRGAPFQLKSGPAGGWGETGYSKTSQQRAYEARTGLKTTKRAE